MGEWQRAILGLAVNLHFRGRRKLYWVWLWICVLEEEKAKHRESERLSIGACGIKGDVNERKQKGRLGQMSGGGMAESYTRFGCESAF